MTFPDLVPYLLNPERLDALYEQYNLDKESEGIQAYAVKELTLEAEIVLFETEETDDDLVFEKDGISYIHFFDIDHAIDLLDQLEVRGQSIKNIAKRLLKYRIYDA